MIPVKRLSYSNQVRVTCLPGQAEGGGGGEFGSCQLHYNRENLCSLPSTVRWSIGHLPQLVLFKVQS